MYCTKYRFDGLVIDLDSLNYISPKHTGIILPEPYSA